MSDFTRFARFLATANNDARDWAYPADGTIHLPPLTRPDDTVTIQCGPFADARSPDAAGRGILSGLQHIDLSYNCSQQTRAMVNEFLQHSRKGGKHGLVYTPVAETSQPFPELPERPLMAIAARMLKRQLNVRFMTMSEVEKALIRNHGRRLRTHFLVIPDFQISGPRGFGVAPWLVEKLGEVLQTRADEHLPTILYADDAWALSPQIGAIMDHYYVVRDAGELMAGLIEANSSSRSPMTGGCQRSNDNSKDEEGRT